MRMAPSVRSSHSPPMPSSYHPSQTRGDDKVGMILHCVRFRVRDNSGHTSGIVCERAWAYWKIVCWRALAVVGSSSVGDSVYVQRTAYSAMTRRRQD